MTVDGMVRRALLFDFYGSLLTPKQQEVYDLYFQQDLSLGEIAELKSISRNAVYDLLQRAREALETYEDKLGLVGRHMERRRLVEDLKARLAGLQGKVSPEELSDLQAVLERIEKSW